ncbi:MAG TPA: biotin--[acetyl-CoA-carboxylase] ligase [Ktedonosporobacter sp.]|nr:biotin--[acetyl-CoA-carboxylase] ligase [Ktedonosporobacter sp.]
MNEIETTASRRLNITMLQETLDTHLFGIGDRLVFLPTVDSTNTQAMRLALNGSEEGVVVLTDNQTAGKGRLGRRWIDRAGCNVLSSLVLRPQFPPYLLVMIASLAVVEAIRRSCSITATIKWPNDVLIGQRKVAGILIETSHDRAGRMIAIMGIGVNVNGGIPQADVELQARATTLESECGHRVSRELFITYLLQHLETNYLALQQEAPDPGGAASGVISRLIREQWRTQLSTLGRTIQVRQGNATLSGIAEDVNEVGELLLRNHSGELVNVTWGDVGYPTE